MQPVEIQKSQWLQDNRWWQLLIFCSFLWLIFQLPFWQILDAKYNDYWVRFVAEKTSPTDEIVIIEIDDRSLVSMETDAGHWPWPRSQHAFLIESLRDVNAKAIIFDLFFSEKDIFRPDGDEFFHETVKIKQDVFLAASLLSDDVNSDRIKLSQLPTPFFHKQPNSGVNNNELTVNISLPWIIDPQYWQVGLVNSRLDSDHVFRQYPVYTVIEEWQLPSLPLVVYKSLYQNDYSSEKTTQQIHLKYHGSGKQPYEYISYSDAINNLSLVEQSKKNKAMFSGKIVFIGATATGLHDLRSTPIDANYPGVSILATALDNLINQDYFTSPIKGFRWFLLMLFGLILFYIYLYLSDYKKKLVFSGFYMFSLAGLFFIASWWASSHSYLLGLFSIWCILTIGFVLLSFYQGLMEFLQRQHAMRTFSRFMDPQIVKQLIADKNWISTLAHKTSQVSVLFSDIRGFTSLSEKRSAEQVMQILNDYFDLQVEAIFSTQGTLDKFIGDAVMAFWGAPIEDHKHAEKAVRTALKMVDNLLEFRKSLPKELQDFDVGIGIHSGEAVVGMLGSKRRFDYTAIGDTVNLASRIEGVTKGRARVLVSQVTKDLCEDKFEFLYSGEFSVKGREEKVKLYEPKELSSNNAET
jgi:adenylate cyclase